ncbi:MAG TPA: hypothetical protein VKD25_01825 [Burkholderiales bacterium]|nr:hypothetical protein [Burkholderiales bacterium]
MDIRVAAGYGAYFNHKAAVGAQPGASSTKFQAPNLKQAPNPKPQAPNVWNLLLVIWDLRR